MGSTVGAFIGGVNAEKFGRKKAMLFDGLCMFIGLTLIGFCSYSFPIILVGRFICGSAASSLQTIVPAYVSEISQPAYRNATGLQYMVCFTLGMVAMLAMGTVLPWALAVKILSGFSILHLAVLSMCPESPIWLITNGKIDEAKNVLQSLRKSDLLVKLELDRIKRSYEEAVCHSDTESDTKGDGLQFYLSLFRDKAFLKPLATLALVFVVFCEWSGLPPLAFFLVQLLMDAKIPVDPYIATVGIFAFRSAVLIIGNFIVARFKMRVVFFSTTICHLFVMSMIALYSYLNKDGWLTENFPTAGWTPIICIMLLYATAGVGCFNVIFSFTGVLFPSYARTFGSGLIGVLDNIALVGTSSLFPYMLEAFGLHGSLMVNIICVASSGIILWFTLPETYGVTLEDIEQFYRSEKNSKEKVTE